MLDNNHGQCAFELPCQAEKALDAVRTEPRCRFIETENARLLCERYGNLESPAIAIVQGLQDGGAKVRAFDPEGMEAAREYLPEVQFGADPYEISDGADAVVLVTEWDAFRALDFPRLKSLMREPLLVDLRNVYRRDRIARYGFRYVSIGRPKEDIPVALSQTAEAAE